MAGSPEYARTFNEGKDALLKLFALILSDLSVFRQENFVIGDKTAYLC